MTHQPDVDSSMKAAAPPPVDGAWLRREDERLLTGRGCFVGDLRLPGLLHAVFARSAHAHGCLRELAVADARAMPGVRAVFTATDFAKLPAPQVNRLLPDIKLPVVGALAADRVLAVGAVLALVVADSLAQARAAADQVWADIDELPPHHDAAEPSGGGMAPPVDPALPDNQVASAHFEAGTLPQRAPDVRVAVAQPRVAAAALEPRAAVLQWRADAGPTGGLRAWLSTQTPRRARDELALALGLPAESVQVIAPDVGGAFGGKASIGPEELMLAQAARQLGAALRWQATRSEEMLSAPQGRASRAQGALWLDAEHRIEALQAQFQFSLGHWLTYSAVVPARNAARIVPGPYRVAHSQARATCTLSNAAAVGIYRGAGRPEAALLMERLLDEAAHQRGIDPLALRRINVWPSAELPRTLPNGQWLDRCDLVGLLDQAAELFGYTNWRQRQAERRAAGQCLGIGIGLYVEPCGQGPEAARLTARPDGSFVLATGSTAQGQGRETSFARIAAQALGCRADQVQVLHGDTALCPPGIGALASRSTAIGGSAVLLAARALREKLQAGAALPCTVEQTFSAEREAWASGCVMAAAAVDVATGALRVEDLAWVDDAGVVIVPELVEGQLRGGMAQGLGQALMERVVYDAQGQLLTGSLMDYALPRAADMPPLRLAGRPTPSAANPLGAKGVGEAGCIGVPAALLNATLDALRPLGVKHLDFPLTDHRLWQALQDAQRKPTSSHTP